MTVNSALRTWRYGAAMPLSAYNSKDVDGARRTCPLLSSRRLWKPNTACEDMWALRYPHYRLNPTSRSCAWARLRGGCDALANECNSSCADCRAGLPYSDAAAVSVRMAAGHGASTNRRIDQLASTRVRVVQLQITSTRSSGGALSQRPQLSEVRLYSGFRRLKVTAARTLHLGALPTDLGYADHATNLLDDDLNTKYAHSAAVQFLGASRIHLILQVGRPIGTWATRRFDCRIAAAASRIRDCV